MHITKRMSAVVLLIGGMLLLGQTAVSIALAQSNLVPLTLKKSKATLKSTHYFRSDDDSSGGKLSLTETRLGVAYEFEALNGLPLAVGFSHKHTGIDTDDIPTQIPSHLEGTILSMGTKFPIPFVSRDDVFAGVDLMPSMFTDGGWENSAFRLPFRVYGIYKPEESFILVAGVQVRPDYEENAVLPIFGIIYKPDDRWTINFASSEPSISYKIDPRLTAFWEFDFISNEYEVTRGSQEGVVLHNRSISTGAGMEYNMDDKLAASVALGTVFCRKLEYSDDLGEVEPDAGLYLRGKLTYRF